MRRVQQVGMIDGTGMMPQETTRPADAGSLRLRRVFASAHRAVHGIQHGFQRRVARPLWFRLAARALRLGLVVRARAGCRVLDRPWPLCRFALAPGKRCREPEPE
jgi:hypothetical protein